MKNQNQFSCFDTAKVQLLFYPAIGKCKFNIKYMSIAADLTKITPQ